MATVPLMLLFMVQFTLTMTGNAKIQSIDNIVYTAKEIAKQEGGFSSGNISEMKDKIAKVCGIEADDIIVQCSPAGSRRRMSTLSGYGLNTDMLIHYSIKVPMQEMSVFSSLIRGGRKQYYYVVDNYTASEYL